MVEAKAELGGAMSVCASGLRQAHSPGGALSKRDGPFPSDSRGPVPRSHPSPRAAEESPILAAVVLISAVASHTLRIRGAEA